MSVPLRFARRDFRPTRLPFLPIFTVAVLGILPSNVPPKVARLTPKVSTSANFTCISPFCGDALSFPAGVSRSIGRRHDTADSAPPIWHSISLSKFPPMRHGFRRPLLFHVSDLSAILRREIIPRYAGNHITGDCAASPVRCTCARRRFLRPPNGRYTAVEAPGGHLFVVYGYLGQTPPPPPPDRNIVGYIQN